MTNLHIIIGDSNTRKSSLLRCLTGVGNGNAKKKLDVAISNGTVISVHCTLSALQENYKPLTPVEFIHAINAQRPTPTDIAFTLRVNARGIYPNANTYLQAYQQVAGWRIVNIALLGTSARGLQGLPPTANIVRVPSSKTRPTNESAQSVRQAWGWI